jgi:hypothetical protein
MTLSAVSHYRGGTLEDVAPASATLKAAYARYGIGYQLSRFETGPNAGDWLVIVRYANEQAYAQAQTAIAQDAACQQAFVDIARYAVRVSRELVTDIDL